MAEVHPQRAGAAREPLVLRQATWVSDAQRRDLLGRSKEGRKQLLCFDTALVEHGVTVPEVFKNEQPDGAVEHDSIRTDREKVGVLILAPCDANIHVIGFLIFTRNYIISCVRLKMR